LFKACYQQKSVTKR